MVRAASAAGVPISIAFTVENRSPPLSEEPLGEPARRLVGGCCGTDKRHIAAICDAWPSC